MLLRFRFDTKYWHQLANSIRSWWYVYLSRVSWGKIQTDVLHEQHWWKWFLVKRRICQDAQVWSPLFFSCLSQVSCFFFFCLFVCVIGHRHRFDVLQVFHWNLQRCPVKEPGRRRHQGHDGGCRLWWQGENLMGGLPFPLAGPREWASVCSTQCQRS